MLSGGTPVVVGPDGPSLGGFVVPCVVVARRPVAAGAGRAPATRCGCVPVTPEQADAANAAARRAPALRDVAAAWCGAGRRTGRQPARSRGPGPAPLLELAADGARPRARRPRGRRLPPARRGRARGAGPAWCGSAGAPARPRPRRARARRRDRERRGRAVAAAAGRRARRCALAGAGRASGRSWPARCPTRRPSSCRCGRSILPIALDDPSVHEAMARYARSVRPDAPWCPDNVEFIRRVNDLDDRADVFDVVTAATYLVVGLGDVYLGAPVAVPLDPRHRLVIDQVRPGAHLDAAERRRHRRRVPVRLRHGGPGRLPARRPHRARLAARRDGRRSSRGCCAPSTGCGSAR